MTLIFVGLLIGTVFGFGVLMYSLTEAASVWEEWRPIFGGLVFGICGILFTGTVTMMVNKAGKPVGTRTFDVGAQYKVLASHDEHFIVQQTDQKTTPEPLFVKKRKDETIPPQFVVAKDNKLFAIRSDTDAK